MIEVYVSKKPGGLLKAIRKLKRAVRDDKSLLDKTKLRDRYPKPSERKREKTYRSKARQRKAEAEAKRRQAYIKKKGMQTKTTEPTERVNSYANIV